MDIKQFASMGGKARAAKLSKSQLSQIGKKAIAQRWLKHTTLTVDVSETENHIQIPKPEPRRCQASYCAKVGREVLVQGIKAWLCEAHG